MSTGADATTALLPVLIVGAGPAGLASAACFKQRGIEPLVLEAGASLANSWRHHYDRLRLHTVKQHSPDPLADIGATRKLRTVMVEGGLYDPAALLAEVEAAAKRDVPPARGAQGRD